MAGRRGLDGLAVNGALCDSTGLDLMASGKRDAGISTAASGPACRIDLGAVLYLTSTSGSRAARAWRPRLAGASGLAISF